MFDPNMLICWGAGDDVARGDLMPRPKASEPEPCARRMFYPFGTVGSGQKLGVMPRWWYLRLSDAHLEQRLW